MKKNISLAFTLGLLLLPVASSSALSASSHTTVTFERDPVLSITASSIAELVNPAKNTLLTPATTVTVSTNNETGYTLSMSDPSGNSLTDAEVTVPADPTTFIASIASATTISSVSDLATNHWAWNKINTSASPTPATRNSDTTAYNPLPSSSDSVTLTETTAQAQSSQTSVTFAINLDNRLPAGSYSDVVYFSVIANPANSYDPARFFALTSMQGMTANICNSVTTPSAAATTSVTSLTDYEAVADKTTVVPELHLRDLRDDQVYTVRKLADGNCWMTENLRYGANPDGSINTDLADATKIDVSNTNSPASGFSVAAIDNAATGISNWGETYTIPKINIYQANEQNEYGTTYNTTKYGALYNYCAATAGNICTDASVTPSIDIDGEASGSICPHGWRLPSYLITQYDTSNITTDGSVKSIMNIRNLYGINGGGSSSVKLSQHPLDFITAGYISSTSILGRSNPGNSGIWSSTVKISETDKSYTLYFSNSGTYRDAYTRRMGYSVRCVAS